EKCLAKAERLKQYDNLTIGAHHDLPTLWKFAQKHETPATPNVLAIYTLGKIAEDFNRIGVEKLRKETERKSGLLYNLVKKHENFEASVKVPRLQSQTVVVANTKIESATIIGKLKEKGMVIGSGYGEFKNSQVRIANFPATSVEETEKLVKALGEI
ncbi:aminotransferase class V-fold PLP-dependent enzyme, partial [Persicitalea sp.]|uniref:aminotransferase class V-fold PLP-dependent enzyme n=1 Tax=Persicitalea sp. TaxID=3100273 RepID=UPI003593FDAB